MAGKFKFKYLSKDKDTGVSYEKLVQEQAKDLGKTATDLGKQLRNVQLGRLEGSEGFFRELNDSLAATGLSNDPEVMKAYKRLTGEATQKQLSSALAQLAGHLKRAGSALPTQWNIGHKTMEPINVSISLTIMAIQSALLELEAKGEANTVFYRKQQLTAQRLRKLRAIGHVISQAEKKNDLENKQIVAKLKDMKKDGHIDISHLKQLDLKLNDGTLARYQIETEDLNKDIKGVKQKTLGAMRKALVSGTSAGMSSSLAKALSDADITSITGSKSIGKELGEQLVEAAVGKKKRTYRKTTKGKKRVKTQVDTQKITTKARKVGTGAAIIAKQLEAQNKVLRAASVGKSTDDEALSLNKIKYNINRSLGAEVRRNMGRPALINRTGQFSNSARLLSLRDTGNTLTGEYTYTLTGGGQSKNKRGVYSTFENLGAKQWPRGYNPKPLIAKSIRNLALKYTERKFTLRRV